MPRIFTWRHKVRSYEGDVGGEMTPGGLLRLCEHIAVEAAADAGFDRQFHIANNSAWVIHRMTLLIDAPARQMDELELQTWASHFTRVRGGREYRIRNLTTGLEVASGIAEWVYVDRSLLTPKGLPMDIMRGFDIPGKPLGTYDAPEVAQLAEPIHHVTPRKAEWHEIDSMHHVNNAVYADWLHSGVWSAAEKLTSHPVAMLYNDQYLRARYFDIRYRRAALPGDDVQVVTSITGLEGPLVEARQSVSGPGVADLVNAHSVYRWYGPDGDPPQAAE
ncbi:MAG TPA: acyl-ACP thioesterase domain-containing protein [Chloroflexia bacterium]|nr:acyl-ACP thioesterase domain-containing protein [Chloroflexia bacterium]